SFQGCKKYRPVSIAVILQAIKAQTRRLLLSLPVVNLTHDCLFFFLRPLALLLLYRSYLHSFPLFEDKATDRRSQKTLCVCVCVCVSQPLLPSLLTSFPAK